MAMLRKCVHGYTMKETCECGRTHSAHPPKYRERFVKYIRGDSDEDNDKAAGKGQA